MIICPDNSLSLLKSTANSIKSKYYDHPFICVANGSATVEDVAMMKCICPTYKGKKTISSMINVGLRHAPADWAFIVFSGSFLPGKMDEKFSFFINSEKDILFPIVNRKTNFIDEHGTVCSSTKKHLKKLVNLKMKVNLNTLNVSGLVML